MKCNKSCLGFELVSPCPFPTTITITPRQLYFLQDVLSRYWRSSSFFSWLIYSVYIMWCKALCIIMSVLVLKSICWSSSLVYFNNGSSYLTKRIAQVFISSMGFLPHSFLSTSFLVFLRNSFSFFFFYICLFDGVYFRNPHVFISFPFSVRSNFLYLVVLFLPSFVGFCFSL